MSRGDKLNFADQRAPCARRSGGGLPACSLSSCRSCDLAGSSCPVTTRRGRLPTLDRGERFPVVLAPFRTSSRAVSGVRFSVRCIVEGALPTGVRSGSSLPPPDAAGPLGRSCFPVSPGRRFFRCRPRLTPFGCLPFHAAPPLHRWRRFHPWCGVPAVACLLLALFPAFALGVCDFLLRLAVRQTTSCSAGADAYQCDRHLRARPGALDDSGGPAPESPRALSDDRTLLERSRLVGRGSLFEWLSWPHPHREADARRLVDSPASVSDIRAGRSRASSSRPRSFSRSACPCGTDLANRAHRSLLDWAERHAPRAPDSATWFTAARRPYPVSVLHELVALARALVPVFSLRRA